MSPVTKTVFVGLLAAFATAGAQSPSTEQELAETIIKKAMAENQAIRILERIVSVGPRLSGSPQTAAAVELTRQMMVDLGFEDVHLEPVKVPRWVRGPVEKALIVNSHTLGTVPLAITALGGSGATPEGGLTAEVVEVRSIEEARNLGDQLRGKITFFNRPMNPTELETFRAYGGAVDQRVRGPAVAAQAGAVAALVRSITTRHDNVPHTGVTIFRKGERVIPAAAVSLQGADLLHQVLSAEGTVRVHLELACSTLTDVPSANVVAQITGRERPGEIVLLGAHLDSWDVGQGAHDDGAGCAHVIEALRLLKELGLRPRRTIRGVLFMNEENGSRGARAYPKAPQRRGEVHVAAIESDRGGFAPRGFTVSADSSTVSAFRRWAAAFRALGADRFTRGGGGADISPLRRDGTLTLGLNVECARYFDVHHSSNDVLEAVNGRELEMGAAAMAIMAYLLAEEGVPR
ncbi:MAG TPA: M20/M25/M40 family metallo-hydrolase [Bacteroidetes bacterium]|nr:M20/M25/M40 family metallo-hydrolase [Bacteroidota bacterium]